MSKGQGHPTRSIATARKMSHMAKAKDHLARSIKMKEMRDKGYSNVAIGKHMGVSESTVRRVLQQCDIHRG